MEATHLGAWLAGGEDDELAKALALLSPPARYDPVDPQKFDADVFGDRKRKP